MKSHPLASMLILLFTSACGNAQDDQRQAQPTVQAPTLSTADDADQAKPKQRRVAKPASQDANRVSNIELDDNKSIDQRASEEQAFVLALRQAIDDAVAAQALANPQLFSGNQAQGLAQALNATAGLALAGGGGADPLALLQGLFSSIGGLNLGNLPAGLGLPGGLANVLSGLGGLGGLAGGLGGGLGGLGGLAGLGGLGGALGNVGLPFGDLLNAVQNLDIAAATAAISGLLPNLLGLLGI